MSESALPATIAQLNVACSGASNDFILSQAKAGASIASATAAYNEVLKLELKSSNDKLTAANSMIETLQSQLKIAQATHGKHGSAPDKPAAEGFSGGDAKAQFNDKVSELTSKGMTRAKAYQKVSRENPELRQAMVSQANA